MNVWVKCCRCRGIVHLEGQKLSDMNTERIICNKCAERPFVKLNHENSTPRDAEEVKRDGQ